MQTHIKRNNKKIKQKKPKLEKSLESSAILETLGIECCNNCCVRSFTYKEVEQERTFMHRKNELEKMETLNEWFNKIFIQENSDETTSSIKGF